MTDSVFSERVRKMREQELNQAREIENTITIGIAALFRAAAIAGRTASDQNADGDEDAVAVDRAKEFIRHCKAIGLWPKDIRRL